MDNQEIPSNPETKNLEAYKAILDINEQEQKLKTKSGYMKSYILSLLLPPIGLYYFIKYFFFTESDGARKAAIINLVLTVVSLILNIWIFQLFFNMATPQNSSNLNFMKELITPENQKSLQQLYQ